MNQTLKNICVTCHVNYHGSISKWFKRLVWMSYSDEPNAKAYYGLWFVIWSENNGLNDFNEWIEWGKRWRTLRGVKCHEIIGFKWYAWLNDSNEQNVAEHYVVWSIMRVKVSVDMQESINRMNEALKNIKSLEIYIMKLMDAIHVHEWINRMNTALKNMTSLEISWD